jgi:Glucodextranase, domain N
MALESSSGFSSESVGYAGTAGDGLTMLDSTHSLTSYNSAPNGHVTLTAEIARGWHDPSVTLALGFGTTRSHRLEVYRGLVRPDRLHGQSGREQRAHPGQHREAGADVREQLRRADARRVREYPWGHEHVDRRGVPPAELFSVCAPGGTSPICKVDPGTVPKVMDTVLPAGVSQATELDPTRGPVVLQGVSP